jgi:hypothetical protein
MSLIQTTSSMTLVAILALSTLTPPSQAQDKDADTRIQALEKQVAELTARLAQLEKTMLGDKLVAKLHGHWDQRSYTCRGKVVTLTDDAIWQLKPEHSYHWILSPEPPRWTLGTMDVDATKEPAWINFRRDRFGDGVRVVPGIVRIVDGRVHLALRENTKCDPHPKDEYPERPTSFESTKENGVSVFVLERPSKKQQ